jgi:hypothetical protein
MTTAMTTRFKPVELECDGCLQFRLYQTLVPIEYTQFQKRAGRQSTVSDYLHTYGLSLSMDSNKLRANLSLSRFQAQSQAASPRRFRTLW